MRLIGICFAMVLSSTAFGNDFFMQTGTPSPSEPQPWSGGDNYSATEGNNALKIGDGAKSGTAAATKSGVKQTSWETIEITLQVEPGDATDGVCSDAVETNSTCMMNTVTDGTDELYNYWESGVCETCDTVKGNSNGYDTRAKAKAQKFLRGNTGGSVDDCLKVANDNCDTLSDTAANTAICDAYEYAWQRALDKGWAVADAKAAVNAFDWGSDTAGGDERFCSVSSGGNQQDAWDTGFCDCAVSGSTVTCGTIDGTACFRK